MFRQLTFVMCLGVLCAAVAQADTDIAVGELGCLPLHDNGVLEATVGGVEGGDQVRLYFRRLNPLGSFFYVAKHAIGEDRYWTTFPKPEDRNQAQLNDDWWEILKGRDWMEGRDREWLEDYLESREQESAEYYVAIHNATGEERARTKTMLVDVNDEDCYTPLTPKQRGLAENMTIGETTPVQVNKEVFHWLCDGIVTRIDTNNILRPDEYCRACVVGIGFVPPLAAVAAGVVSGAIIEHPPEASPRQP